MAAYTLQDCFGPNAIQDANTITISKADFPALTATATNSGESLIVMLLLYWMTTLTESARLADESSRSVAFSDAGTDIYQAATEDYLRHSIAAILYDPYTIPSIDPDNY